MVNMLIENADYLKYNYFTDAADTAYDGITHIRGMG